MCPMMDQWSLNHILKRKDAYSRIYPRAARDIFFFTRFPVTSRLSIAARLADRRMNARKATATYGA